MRNKLLTALLLATSLTSAFSMEPTNEREIIQNRLHERILRRQEELAMSPADRDKAEWESLLKRYSLCFHEEHAEWESNDLFSDYPTLIINIPACDASTKLEIMKRYRSAYTEIMEQQLEKIISTRFLHSVSRSEEPIDYKLDDLYFNIFVYMDTLSRRLNEHCSRTHYSPTLSNTLHIEMDGYVYITSP